tara:strand:+ start:2182 stop:4254 length:2073 start_codon:yes stop_codon:yes gene_type:complete
MMSLSIEAWQVLTCIAISLAVMIVWALKTVGVREKVAVSLKLVADRRKQTVQVLRLLDELLKALPIGFVVVRRSTMKVELMSRRAADLIGKQPIVEVPVHFSAVFDRLNGNDQLKTEALIENTCGGESAKEINVNWSVYEGKSSLGISIKPVAHISDERVILIVKSGSSEPSAEEKRGVLKREVLADALIELDSAKAASKVLDCFVAAWTVEVRAAVTFWNGQIRQWSLLARANLPDSLSSVVANPALTFDRDMLLDSKTAKKCSRFDFDRTFPSDTCYRLERAGVETWAAYPIIDSRGDVMGVMDIFYPSGLPSVDYDENLSVTIKVLSVILERHRAVIHTNGVLDIERSVRTINRELMAHDNTDGLAGIIKALRLIESGANFDQQTTQMLVRCWDGDTEFLSTEQGEGERLSLAFSVIAAWVDGYRAPFAARGLKEPLTQESRFGFFAVSSQDPLFKTVHNIRSLETDGAAEFAVFPLWWVGELEGVLVLPKAKALNYKQLSIVSNVLVSLSGVAARYRLVAELTQKAHYDQLTGLVNRRFMDELLVNEIERCRRYGSPMTVLLLDIDHFKSINDTFGHDAGDRVLETVASRLKAAVRSVDSVARWGGEEFIVMLAETNLSSAVVVGENIRKTVERGEYALNRPVTVSIGVSQLKKDDTVDSLLKRADVALYDAKEKGRNQVVASDPE